jgi:cytochrome c-type biogenesis protein CcmF
MTLSHFGFSLIIAGIIFTSSLDVTKKINIRIGESFDIDNYQIEFEKLSYKHGKNYIVRAGNFKVSKNKQGLTTLNPENRYYPIVSQNTYETSIKHSIFGDLYLVIGNIDEQENFALRAYYKPFIWLIWFGCLLIFSSSFFAIFSRFKLHKPKFTNIANE